MHTLQVGHEVLIFRHCEKRLILGLVACNAESILQRAFEVRTRAVLGTQVLVLGSAELAGGKVTAELACEAVVGFVRFDASPGLRTYVDLSEKDELKYDKRNTRGTHPTSPLHARFRFVEAEREGGLVDIADLQDELALFVSISERNATIIAILTILVFFFVIEVVTQLSIRHFLQPRPACQTTGGVLPVSTELEPYFENVLFDFWTKRVFLHNLSNMPPNVL